MCPFWGGGRLTDYTAIQDRGGSDRHLALFSCVETSHFRHRRRGWGWNSHPSLAVRIICSLAPTSAARRAARPDPQNYLADVLVRIADHPARRICELLSWNWTPAPAKLAA